MKVVSNASPLIALARIGHLDSLRKLYPDVHISVEVYNEVVVAGAGMLGAIAVENADWVHVAPVGDAKALAEPILRTGLGAGEVSAVLLAKKFAADLILMDEHKGRKLAIKECLAVAGCVGILEASYQRGDIPDLRDVYRELLFQKIRVDLGMLQSSLKF